MKLPVWLKLEGDEIIVSTEVSVRKLCGTVEGVYRWGASTCTQIIQ